MCVSRFLSKEGAYPSLQGAKIRDRVTKHIFRQDGLKHIVCLSVGMVALALQPKLRSVERTTLVRGKYN